MKTGKSRFFTLVELLIVVAVICMLMALLLPALRKSKESATGISCKNNMRQCGMAFSTYAGDYNGFIAKQLYLDLWSQVLYNNGYITVISPFFCPACPPSTSGVNSLLSVVTSTGQRIACHTYGIPFMRYDTVEVGYSISTGVSYYYFDTKKCALPSAYLLLADTRSTTGYQAYRFAYASWSGIELRHLKKANSLFLDSHVEGVNISRLDETLGSGTIYIYADGTTFLLP